MLLSSKITTLSLAVALAVTGCATMKIPLIDVSAIPKREYDERVEGNNAVILEDTPQEFNYYIPDTGWREREMEASEEVCTLSLATASESVAEEAEQFLLDQENTLNLSAGEFIVVELNGAHWLSETEVTLANDGTVEIWIANGTGEDDYECFELAHSDRILHEERTLCAFLKIQCPEDGEAVQIQNIRVSGIPTLY